MNIADALLIHPIAMEHARAALDNELDMLSKGIGKKKRFEWLEAVRNRMYADAVLVVPSVLSPLNEALTASDVLTGFETVKKNLDALAVGSSFRAMRSARRRLGLSGEVMDPLSANGAMLLLVDDQEASECLHRMVTPWLDHLSSSTEFAEAEEGYKDIMAGQDLEVNKRRRAIEYGMTVIPSVLGSMPDLPDSFIRDLAYLRGRMLDQDVFLSISTVIKELGAGILDQLRSFIIADSIESYRVVLNAVINARLAELSDTIPRQIQAKSEVESPQAETKLPSNNQSYSLSSFDSLPPLLTMDETATLLRVNKVTVHRRLKDGSIEGRHVGVNHLVLRESVLKYLDLLKKK